MHSQQVLCVGWQVYTQSTTCTASGRFAVSGTNCKNYTYCVYVSSNGSYVAYNYVCPTTSVFNPNLRQCTTNYICTDNSTSTTNSSSVCTADGYFANPNVTDCSSYIECVEINGTYTETVYVCPTDTYYDPSTTFCEADYTCAYNCTAAGRFANTSDTTCKTYYFCVLASNGTYVSYEYTCPSTSVFSPTASVCTTSYTCTTS